MNSSFDLAMNTETLSDWINALGLHDVHSRTKTSHGDVY